MSQPPDRLALLFEFLAKEEKNNRHWNLGDLFSTVSALDSHNWDITGALENVLDLDEVEPKEKINRMMTPYSLKTVLKADEKDFEEHGMPRNPEIVDPRLHPDRMYLDEGEFSEKFIQRFKKEYYP